MRRRQGRDQAGQAMVIVMSVVLVLTLGSAFMVQDTFQQFPIVTQDTVVHEAYRAMEAGLNEYLYQSNVNANFVVCNANIDNAAGALVTVSPLQYPAGICSQMAFGTWVSVPGTASTNGPPSWFLLGDPTINDSTGVTSVDVVGAAGYPNDYNFQTAVLTLKPLNNFLLNVLWTDYDQIDPQVIDPGSPPHCPYNWVTPVASPCINVTFASTDAVHGNLYTNDSIWVCDAPTFGNVVTADPNEYYIQTCGGAGPSTATWTKDYNPPNKMPTDLSKVQVTAVLGGCEFQGPTPLQLNGTTMTVTSPNTPTGVATGGSSPPSNDALDDAADTNQCMPFPDTYSGSALTSGHAYAANTALSLGTALTTAVAAGDTIILTSGAHTQTLVASAASAAGTTSIKVQAFTANYAYPSGSSVVDNVVPLPSDGVIYVQDCVSGGVAPCNSNYNPLSGTGETFPEATPQYAGDVVVQGTISTPTTIGADNNIVIDGDLCYTADVQGTAPNQTCSTGAPPATSTAVLGLVAQSYVEVNHPVGASACPNTGGGTPADYLYEGTTACALQNPVIDGVMLASEHSFIVNNYASNATDGTLTVAGTIDEEWRGPVGTISGSTVVSGYDKNYVYDPRLEYLSPPYYLDPGTSAWGLDTFTVAAGACKLPAGQTCPAGYP